MNKKVKCDCTGCLMNKEGKYCTHTDVDINECYTYVLMMRGKKDEK